MPRRWQMTFGPSSRIQERDVPPPASYVKDDDIIPDRPRQNEKQNVADQKRAAAWKVATSPVSGIVMYLLLLFLIPNAISIYSISFAVIALMNPIRAAFSVNVAFRSFESDLPATTLGMYKAIYVAIQLFFVGVALYKIMKLGLLPVTSSDWLYFYGVPQPKETVLIPRLPE